MQFVVARVLDALDLVWCHTPNGQLRDPVIAGRLVSAGVKAGVPDCMIYSGQMALELKSLDGSLSADQRRWLERLAALGWRTGWERGTRKSLERLDAWGLDVAGALDQVERTLGYRLEGGRMVKLKRPTKGRKER